MKFIQISSLMMAGPMGPIIAVFALGEDGNVYSLTRTPGKDYWDRINGELRDAIQETPQNLSKSRSN